MNIRRVLLTGTALALVAALSGTGSAIGQESTNAPASATNVAASGRGIVGSWLGTSGEGNKLVASFTSDGIVISSVQTEVSTNPALGVLTPGHGVWRNVGGRQFEYTVYGILYDINTGALMGTLRAKATVAVSGDEDVLSGTDRVDIYDPAGNLMFSVPPGPVEYHRIRPEPFDK